MGDLRTVEHAAASLWLGLAMGATTTVHHFHAALVMRSTGPGLHVVWTEAVLMPVAAVSLMRFVRTGDRTALRVHALAPRAAGARPPPAPAAIVPRGRTRRCSSCPARCARTPPGSTMIG